MSTNNESTAEGGNNEPVIEGSESVIEDGAIPEPENQPGPDATAESVEEGAEGQPELSDGVTPEEAAAEIEANAATAQAADRLVANAIASSVTIDNARTLVQQALREDLKTYAWIATMTTEQVVYEVYDCCGYDGSYGYVARDYSVAENGAVSFTGEPVPVNLMVNIVPRAVVSANGVSPGANQQQGNGQMADENNAGTGAGGEQNANGAGDPPAPRTLETFLADVPPEVAAVVNEGIALRTQKKNTLVQGILTNSNGLYTEDELNAKDLPELEKLHTLSRPAPTSFEGRAVPLFGSSATEGISTNSRASQNSVPVAPRAFEAKPTRKADYSNSNDASATAA
jgi:hypothetical protein